MTILDACGISKSYLIGGRKITVLDNVSLSVAEGEFLVVKGESGSGKSTLLTLLSGLDRPDSGSILIGQRNITDLGEDQLAPIRNKSFGFVFQSFHLIPSLTTLENVMFPAELAGDRQGREKAGNLLARVGLSGRSDSLPHQLSGGEKQRCAICRAMVNNPAIIFADEPTGNLDSASGRAVLDLLLELRAESRTTLVLVTHSPEIARRADRIVTIRDGRLMADDGHD